VTALTTFVIEVNEGAVETSQQGVDFWNLHRQRFAASGKLRETKAACIVGGIVELGPYDRDDAEFMASHMVESGGMPRTAIKVKAVRR
jgi:hypothetical protein